MQISKILVSQKTYRADRRKEFGMKILELSAPEGRFSFYFPDDINEKDSFTYSVQMQPFGLTDADRTENEKTLSAYRIEFGSRPLSVTTTLQQITVGSAPLTADAVMRTIEGFETVRTAWTFSQQSATDDDSEKPPQPSTELEIDTQQPP